MSRIVVLLTLTLSLFTPAMRGLQAQSTWLLQAGAGPGSVSFTTDQFGTYGNTTYVPYGGGPNGGAIFLDNEVYIRVGLVGPRQQLATAATAPTAMTGVPLTSCTNNFTVGGLSFKLDQSVTPLMVMPGPIQNGLTLTQVYTITNSSAATIDFDLVKNVHSHFPTTSLGGGRKAGPPETFFQFDTAHDPRTCQTEYSFVGGNPIVADRYEFASGGADAISGNPLPNTVQGDGNADGLIDPANEIGSHSCFAVRNEFNLAAGATTTYTITITITGESTPVVPPTKGLKLTGSPTVKEAGATGTYTVELLSLPTGSVTVTMGPDSQVSVLPKTLTFTIANWNVPQTVTVTAVDDAITEGKHFGKITHATASSDAGYVSANFGTVTATIIDDDNLNKFEGNYPFSQKPPTILNVGEGAFGYSRSVVDLKSSRLPILTRTAGPNGERVLNVAFQKASESVPASNSGAALAIGGGLILAAGLVLAAKRSSLVG